MRAKARAAQIDVIDLGMGNPDGATPRVIVNKLIEAARNPRNHRYSQSRGTALCYGALGTASVVLWISRTNPSGRGFRPLSLSSPANG